MSEVPSQPDGIFPPIDLEGVDQESAVAGFEGAGGRRLLYRVVSAPHPRRHVVYVHGIESHGTWFLPAAYLLRQHGVTTYLLDRRGSGLNREPDPGDAASAGELLEDVRRFRLSVQASSVHLVGLSWGGKLALTAALDKPSGVDGVALITPGLRAQVDLGVAAKLAVAWSLLRGGRRRFKVPITPELFTDTPRFLEFIRRDPWRTEHVTARFLAASVRLDRLIRARLRELRVPVLLLLAGEDRIVDNEGVEKVLSPLGSRLQVRVHDGAMHSLQFDRLRAMVSELLAFL